jgi:hypothetical protein
MDNVLLWQQSRHKTNPARINGLVEDDRPPTTTDEHLTGLFLQNGNIIPFRPPSGQISQNCRRKSKNQPTNTNWINHKRRKPSQLPRHLVKAAATASSHLSITRYKSLSNATLTVIPMSFGQANPDKPSKLLNQSACGLAAFQLLQQHWIVYGFTSGHFFTSCQYICEHITVHLAADTNERGRSFLKSFGKVTTFVNSAIELLQQIRTSYTLSTQGYFISGQHTLEKLGKRISSKSNPLSSTSYACKTSFKLMSCIFHHPITIPS